MKPIRIGTRGSPLALVQTQEVIRVLETHHSSLKGKIEIVPVKTTGDTLVDRSLTDVGGKSLFTKEIEEAQALPPLSSRNCKRGALRIFCFSHPERRPFLGRFWRRRAWERSPIR